VASSVYDVGRPLVAVLNTAPTDGLVRVVRMRPVAPAFVAAQANLEALV
jgi:hypothetical protein